MPRRPMQTHTQRQAWEGHSAIAHPPAPLWPGTASGRTSVPTPGPKGTAGLESALVCLEAWSAHTGGRGGVSELLTQSRGWGWGLVGGRVRAAGAMGAALLRDGAGLAMV